MRVFAGPLIVRRQGMRVNRYSARTISRLAECPSESEAAVEWK